MKREGGGDAISRESNGISEETVREFDAFGDDGCECGGDGWIVDDCFEDTCCCLEPESEHGMVPCPTCNPRGKL